ncbi:hypothetical protein DB88DRAFT_547476 [Papiliotrema laurentii]|uniref:Uncharacterized protein n=1 Tax=Papiliotrema laurentii TaxID=5418 RepID=A0AAD9FPE6_PAPLA|nr:hypothetical protein DB88DRAFT_547476 [Papiliotrema laurentii]
MPEIVSPVAPATPLVISADSPPESPRSSTFTASSWESEPSESHTPQGSPTSPPPLLPLTPASAPSPTSLQTPPEARETRYFISPHKMHARNCRCVRPRRELTTANQHIRYMMGRLEKVMQRMMEVNQVDTEVRDAFLRILYELRGRGWELFHLVGWQSPLQDNSPRRAYHIEFMLPDIEEPTCHRVLAEMAVHIIEEGRSPGRVGTVAVRYAEDWEDWTLSQPIELAKDDKAGPARLVMLETPMKQGRRLRSRSQVPLRADLGPIRRGGGGAGGHTGGKGEEVVGTE